MKARFLSLIFLLSFLLSVPAGAVIPSSLAGPDLASDREVSVDLKSNKLKVVVFLSARCPCSRSYQGILKALAKEFPEYEFVGVHSNADEPLEESKKHFTEAALGFPVIQDVGAKWADAFGALKTPHVYILDAAGEVVYAGGVGDSRKADQMKNPLLREALLALKAGKKPEQSVARVLGCVIQRL